MKPSWQPLLTTTALLACVSSLSAYLVGLPVDLEKLTAEADIVFKGTLISSEPVQDEWFKPCQDFVVLETQFKVVSPIKGKDIGETVRFRHYDSSPTPQGRSFEPQFYHFQAGRAYVVFAKKTEAMPVFRQIWANHTGKEDQGVLLCREASPIAAKTVKEIFWNELTILLEADTAGDITYAIQQLDGMSDAPKPFSGTNDFDRHDVLVAIHPLIRNSNRKSHRQRSRSSARIIRISPTSARNSGWRRSAAPRSPALARWIRK